MRGRLFLTSLFLFSINSLDNFPRFHMAAHTALRNAFESFSNFGGSKSSLNGPTTMDNAHFAKFCRDANIIGKNITTVDVDIFYKKVRLFRLK